jgi:hypothetical protein
MWWKHFSRCHQNDCMLVQAVVIERAEWCGSAGCTPVPSVAPARLVIARQVGVPLVHAELLVSGG